MMEGMDKLAKEAREKEQIRALNKIAIELEEIKTVLRQIVAAIKQAK